MALVRNAARIARATELRNLAVDLVALRGAMTDAQAGNKNIQVMMYENDRLAVLYKTPRLDLSTEGAPAWIQPTGARPCLSSGTTKDLSTFSLSNRANGRIRSQMRFSKPDSKVEIGCGSPDGIVCSSSAFFSYANSADRRLQNR
jgi:hypothetical protein